MTEILQMRSITKTFPGVKALSDVTLTVERGEIHAICGENGAGKSTLMKVLSGVYPHGSYEGEIVFEGEEVQFGSINDSEAKGIVIIHQELALVPYLSIAENIFLGNEVRGAGGLIVGIWHGFWVAFVGIPGFIVTLGGMLIFRGLTYQVLNSISLSPFGGTYYEINNGFQNGLLGGQGIDVFTLVVFAVGAAVFCFMQWRTRQGRIEYKQVVETMPLFIGKLVLIVAVIMFLGFELASSRGLPNVLVLVLVLFVVYSVLSQRSVFGRHVYAIGGNLNAAQLSGVRVRRVNFWIFVNMGLLAAVAGIVYSSRMNAAQPGAGSGLELDAIAACFIGGASTTGGIGRVGGAMIGGLLMAVISNIMSLLGWPAQLQSVVKGIVLLLAVAFDLWNRRRSEVAA